MFDFLKSGSAKIQAEIEAESQRAQEAVTTEARLKEARADALLAGDSKEFDRIDAQLVASSRDAGRRAERVQLLQQKLTQAQEREESERLDAIAERADKARKIGENLLHRDYAKQAAALAETITKLRALDHFIDTQNRVLHSNGRETVANSNAVRHILPRVETIKRRRRVGIADELHPNHFDWKNSTYHEPSPFGPPSDEIHLPGGKSFRRFMDVEYDEVINHSPTWAAPVWEAITILPKATSDHVPFYSADPRWKSWGELDKLVAEMGV